MIVTKDTAEPEFLPKSFSDDLNKGKLLIIVMEEIMICGEMSIALVEKYGNAFKLRERRTFQPCMSHVTLTEVRISCCRG